MEPLIEAIINEMTIEELNEKYHISERFRSFLNESPIEIDDYVSMILTEAGFYRLKRFPKLLFACKSEKIKNVLILLRKENINET